MKIPKLANGGIIADFYPFQVDFGEKKIKNAIPFYDIHYKIYHRTKNRRIKNKQLKKSPFLYLEKKLKDVIKKPLKIEINGKTIYEDKN